MTHQTQKWVLMSSVIMLVTTILLATHTSTGLSQSLSDEGCYDPKPHNNLNGYCNSWGDWVPGYITNDTWMTPAPNYIEGKMVFYGPNVMRATAEYRDIDYEEMGCIDGVSLMSPIDIGKKVWIKVENKWHGPFCSVDCARKGDMYSIVVTRDEVIEVSFNFAESLGMVSLVPKGDRIFTAHEWCRDVEIYIASSHAETEIPYLGNKEPVNYSEWFLENLEFAVKWEPRVIGLKNWNWKLWGHDIFWRDADYWDTSHLNVGKKVHPLILQKPFFAHELHLHYWI